MRKIELTEESWKVLETALSDAWYYRLGEASGLEDPDLDEGDRELLVAYRELDTVLSKVPNVGANVDRLSATVKQYDHDARPDDDPEPGDRCKDCGDDVTWLPGTRSVVGDYEVDWLHVDDPRNR